jgi:hypothetical protein
MYSSWGIVLYTMHPDSSGVGKIWQYMGVCISFGPFSTSKQASLAPKSIISHPITLFPSHNSEQIATTNYCSLSLLSLKVIKYQYFVVSIYQLFQDFGRPVEDATSKSRLN